MVALPTGTITFLFTDIEGSTRLLGELGDDYIPVLERHQAIIRSATQGHAGVEVKTEGDSFFCVFDTAADAIAAAVDIQRGMASEDWTDGRQVRVRIGVHTGVAALGGDDYVGMDVHRAARIGDTGHGGQVLVSEPTRLLGQAGLPDGVNFRDLGEVHLKDLEEPEHLYQLLIDGLDSTFPPPRKLVIGPSNLPAPTSTFVGRTKELDEVTALVKQARLVTMTGVAGAGKSRLALAVAAASTETFSDGVWMVELASLSSDALVAQTVAHEIGLQESPDRSATDVLVDFVGDGTRLLVLDNCEHVVAGVRELASRLTGAADDLHVLATSRQVLGAAGETRYNCPPLTIPQADESPQDLEAFDSIALFAARAREVDPSFELDDDNAPVVATICRRLDGMPLAIELAAALLRIMAPAQILERLDDRFDVLTGGPQSAPRHQQTLQAALDSTFELLDETEQEVAARLSVFVGDFDASAVEAVATGAGIDDAVVLETLSSLVDRSLVTSVEAHGERRLRITESVRDYLAAKLKAGGKMLSRQIAHARYYGDLVKQASAGLRGPDQDTWALRLDKDIENVRAAIAFTASSGDDVALQLASQLFLYWRSRGDWSDGLHWTRHVLDNTPARDSGLRARMTATAGFFASDLGDSVGGITDLEEGLAMAQRVGDVHAEAYCSSFLGAELSRRDLDLNRGLELLATAQAIYADLGESYGEAWVNRYLALSHQEQGNLDEALSLHRRSLEAFQEVGDTWNTRFAQTLVAEAMHTVAELPGARQLYDESLRGSSAPRYKVVIAHAHKGLGKVALAEGKHDEASSHLQEALRLLQEIGDVACTAETRGHIAMVKLARGHPKEARNLLVGSLETFREITDKGGAAWSLERLAAVASAQGSPQRAARLLGASASCRQRTGSVRPPVDEPDHDRLTKHLVEEMGTQAYAAAIDSGAALDDDGAVGLGLSDGAE